MHQWPRTVAVVGATGLVGQEIIRLLEERSFPFETIRLFASSRSAGTTVEVRGAPVTVEDLAATSTEALRGIDVALFSAGGERAKTHAPRFVEAGALVVDNSSAFRSDPDVPLVVPEINGAAVAGMRRGIIANPNCTTIILLMALAPIHRTFGVERGFVATYQSVSGAGKAAVDEMRAQAGGSTEHEVFDRPIMYNLIPAIGGLEDNGYYQEELKVTNETKKILDPAIELMATVVRVPVVRCHSEAVFVKLREPYTLDAIERCLQESPDVVVRDDLPTPRELEGTMTTHVGRLRKDLADPSWLLFWVVGDQLLKGAALNAVQIAEGVR